MTITTAWILKAHREKRSVADVMREHGEAGSPPFDLAHPFWTGCEAPDRLPTLAELRELQAASAELDRTITAQVWPDRTEPGPKLATCPACRTIYPADESCEPCAADEVK